MTVGYDAGSTVCSPFFRVRDHHVRSSNVFFGPLLIKMHTPLDRALKISLKKAMAARMINRLAQTEHAILSSAEDDP